MSNKAREDWRKAVDREARARSDAGLEEIGKRLRTELGKTVNA
ncbi:MAG: hypothetical protein AB7U86_12920 [Methylocystis sp.]